MKRLISVDVTTILWTDGNHAWFDLWLAPDSEVKVSWGDGKTSVAKCSDDDCCLVSHYYKKRDVEESFHIEFFSDDENAILTLVDGTWEMEVDNLVIENCPAMKALQYHQLCKFDLSGCPNLEYLDIESCSSPLPDFGQFTNLCKLFCQKIKSRELDLSKCPSVEVLDLSFCSNLKKLALANESKLKTININLTELDKHSMEWLDKILKRNGGEIVDFIMPDYISVGCYGELE